MASYSTIRNGSRGSSVSELQRLLNQNGYNLDVDGIFGSNTEAAVRDYQRKNSLAVDGIAGNNTWGSLYGSGITGGSSGSGSGSGSMSGSSSSNKSVADWLSDYDTPKPSYTPSDDLDDLRAQLEAFEAQRPGDYESQYREQIDSLLDEILNRPDFSYDFNDDPLYQQYRDQYTQQGQLAMQDTMGQAAALTGGFGNSYAQSVGQQTYQGYLQQLNNIIPELQQNAYGMYMDEGNTMRTNLGLLQGMDEMDYGRYRDDVDDYYRDLDYYYNRYNNAYGNEYNQYLNELNAWQADRDYWLQRAMQEQEQSNWQAEFDLAQQQANRGGYSGGGGGGSSSRGDDDDEMDFVNPRGYDTEDEITGAVVYGPQGPASPGNEYMNAEMLEAAIEAGTVVAYRRPDGKYEYRKRA